MKKIYATYKQERNAYKDKIIVFKKMTGVPDYCENHKSDCNGEYFRKAMEKKVIVQTADIKAEKNQRT